MLNVLIFANKVKFAKIPKNFVRVGPQEGVEGLAQKGGLPLPPPPLFLANFSGALFLARHTPRSPSLDRCRPRPPSRAPGEAPRVIHIRGHAVFKASRGWSDASGRYVYSAK